MRKTEHYTLCCLYGSMDWECFLYLNCLQISKGVKSAILSLNNFKQFPFVILIF